MSLMLQFNHHHLIQHASKLDHTIIIWHVAINNYDLILTKKLFNDTGIQLQAITLSSAAKDS
jgi:hypothetical protein